MWRRVRAGKHPHIRQPRPFHIADRARRTQRGRRHRRATTGSGRDERASNADVNVRRGRGSGTRRPICGTPPTIRRYPDRGFSRAIGTTRSTTSGPTPLTSLSETRNPWSQPWPRVGTLRAQFDGVLVQSGAGVPVTVFGTGATLAVGRAWGHREVAVSGDGGEARVAVARVAAGFAGPLVRVLVVWWGLLTVAVVGA